MPTKTVLIVDDDKNVSDTVAETLRMKGINTTAVSHGRHILDTIRQVSPDLIVLDLLLPDSSGMKICELLKGHSEFEHIPIVIITVITQGSELSDGFWCAGTKADDFLTKPFDPMVLVAKIEKLLSDTSETTKPKQAV